mgnify:CR=1 FL=1
MFCVFSFEIVKFGMGKIVLGIGTSHSPMLNSLAEDFIRHAEIDQGKSNWQRELYNKEGQLVYREDTQECFE